MSSESDTIQSIVKECKKFFDLLGSNTIMFKINDKFICFDKAEFFKLIDKSNELKISKNVTLLKQVLQYIKDNKTISVWSIDENGILKEQLKIIENKKKLQKIVASSSQKICDDMPSSGRYAKLYKDFVIKSDTSEELNNEFEIYKNIANPSTYNLYNKNYVTIVSKGSCKGKQDWIALERTGDSLDKFLYDNKISSHELISYVLKSLAVYKELFDNGYTHGDFKPQNLLVVNDSEYFNSSMSESSESSESSSSESSTYGDSTSSVKSHSSSSSSHSSSDNGNIIKIIDFGTTVHKKDKKMFLKDMNRFFTLLVDINGKNNKEMCKKIKMIADKAMSSESEKQASSLLNEIIHNIGESSA